MILALLDRYVQEHEKDSVSYLEDLNKTKEVLNNLDLYDMKGGLLMVEDRLAGFSLGEVLGGHPVHPHREGGPGDLWCLSDAGQPVCPGLCRGGGLLPEP